MAVAVPVYASTGSKTKAIQWTFLSGLVEPLGALAFVLVLNSFVTNYVVDCLLAMVAGIMIILTIKELIPISLKYIDEGKCSVFFLGWECSFCLSPCTSFTTAGIFALMETTVHMMGSPMTTATTMTTTNVHIGLMCAAKPKTKNRINKKQKHIKVREVTSSLTTSDSPFPVSMTRVGAMRVTRQPSYLLRSISTSPNQHTSLSLQRGIKQDVSRRTANNSLIHRRRA